MNCPVCKQPLGVVPGIGDACLTGECPVGDDMYDYTTDAEIAEGIRQLEINREHPV